jgi:DNA-binding beta-propeller fold protein YncE
MKRREFLALVTASALAPRTLVAAAARAPLALVTADLEARLIVVGLWDGRIRGSISTLSHPRSIETVGAVAVVAHSELGAVTLVDTATLRPTHVLRAFREPRYTTAHPGGRYAFVTDARLGEVVTVDVVRGVVVGRAAVGTLARHLTISPWGGTLWVALGSKAEQIAVVDVRRPARPRPIRAFRPPFLAHDVAWSPGGRHVWITSGDRVQVAIYDVRTGSLARIISADSAPQHVTFARDFARDLAYVSSGWSGTVRVHRADGAPVSWSAVPVGSYNVQSGGDRIVTASLERGTITILDGRGRVLRSREIARSCHDACVV